jgi:hypothetical protein
MPAVAQDGGDLNSCNPEVHSRFYGSMRLELCEQLRHVLSSALNNETKHTYLTLLRLLVFLDVGTVVYSVF